MPRKRTLTEYEKKRDFRRTSEPRGGERRQRRRRRPRFVIQKHDARSLHYDFRLEVDGVLRSWAVPKGLATDPCQKRLAVPTEDHPLDYARFEGAIPEGEYGAGTVMVWDTGPYETLTKNDDGKRVSLSKQLDKGHATVWLEGKKLQGGYALTRIAEDKWLVVKMDDEFADARRKPVKTEPRSAISDRTLREIARAEDASEKGGATKRHEKKGRKK